MNRQTSTLRELETERLGLSIFSTSLSHPLNKLNYESQLELLRIVLTQFRERPLCGEGYSEESLRLYDEILGALIRVRNEYRKELVQSPKEIAEFESQWEYQGDIFRIIDKAYVWPKLLAKEPKRRMPRIKWHGMVASWSSSFDFTKGYNHVSRNAKYTFLHSNTGQSVGIDVNKFSSYLDCYNSNLSQENEIIFPMAKSYSVKIYRNFTAEEFKQKMQKVFYKRFEQQLKSFI